MKGLALARDLTLLGAETLVATPQDQLVFQEGQRPAMHVERWQDLAQRMKEHGRQPDPLRQHLICNFGLGQLDYWLVILCTAAERYPEAAAALSILAEDQRIQLPHQSCSPSLYMSCSMCRSPRHCRPH